MRARLFLLPLAGCALIAAAAEAQALVDPGMTKAQVVAKLGAPMAERTADGATYLFYKNGAERRVGINDVVILENDKVVDAVLRSPGRRFTGKSSSPAAIPPAVARMASATPPAPGTGGAPGPSPAAKAPDTKLLPAARAQAADRAKPMPQARSAILDQQKKEAEAKPADAKAADPKAAPAPTKKP